MFHMEDLPKEVTQGKIGRRVNNLFLFFLNAKYHLTREPNQPIKRKNYERGPGKSSWGENSIFNEIVKYGSNLVQTGTFW